jgi:hypothetical protein
MKRTLFKASAAAGAAALLLTACDSSGSADDDASGDSASQDPVYTEMASWDACEVLNDLQPITEYMGIEGWGSITAQGGAPGNSEIGNTLDPDALGCNGMINLGDNEGMGAGGELNVKIVPAESEEGAVAAYEERIRTAEATSLEGENTKTSEFSAPWDQGAVYSWTGTASSPYLEVIAQDGQWVFHIQLNHDQDFGVRNGGEPALAFTDDELRQWFVDTYLPEVNQIVNDRIAEVQ